MKIAIFGAAGQGREIADVCTLLGYEEIVFLVNDETEKCLFPNRVYLDTNEKVDELNRLDFCFSIGVGSPSIRNTIAKKYGHLDFPNIVHPTATFGLYQREVFDNSKGNFINAGVRFTNCIKCGDFGLFNLNATIAHDCVIDSFVSIMAGANISGNVHLKEKSYIGAGATILQGTAESKLVIGKNAVVGAGAVVTRSISPNVTVVGVPANILNK